MMATLLGKEKFRKAMDLYFDTFDGQAVTTQDFVWAMSQAGGIDLTQFEETWYHQERTPNLVVTTEYHQENHQYIIHCEQRIDKNTRGEMQKPFYYPLKIALFKQNGEIISLKTIQTNLQKLIDQGMIIISKEKESFVFENISEEPKLSLNR